MTKTLLITVSVVLAVAGAYFLYAPNRGGTHVDWAKFQLRTLEQAVMAYQMQNGKWPASLEILAERDAEGRPSLLKDSFQFSDPWNRPYFYDPIQLHPQTGKPLLWTEGPNPGKSGSKISNWDWQNDRLDLSKTARHPLHPAILLK